MWGGRYGFKGSGCRSEWDRKCRKSVVEGSVCGRKPGQSEIFGHENLNARVHNGDRLG